MIAQHRGAHRHGLRQPQEEAQPQQPQAQRTQSACEHIEQRPRKPMRENQAHITGRPRVAHGAQPTQLVIDEPAPPVRRHARFYNFRAKRHTIAGPRHARAHLVVVGELIHQPEQASGFFEGLACHRERRTQPVMQSALEELREQYAGNEIRGNAQRFKPRGYGAVRAPAIERRHQADRRQPRILRRRSKAAHDPIQIMRPHRNVGIVDEQNIVARVTGELRQRAHLAVCPQPLGALDEPDRALRKLRLERRHRRRRGIVERTHAEEQLKLARIILPAMAAEGVHHAGVEAFE